MHGTCLIIIHDPGMRLHGPGTKPGTFGFYHRLMSESVGGENGSKERWDSRHLRESNPGLPYRSPVCYPLDQPSLLGSFYEYYSL